MSIANLLRDEIIQNVHISGEHIFVDNFTASSLEEGFNELRVVITPITESSNLLKNAILEISIYHQTHNEAQQVAQAIFDYFTYYLNGNLISLKNDNNLIVKRIDKQADLQNLGFTKEKGFHFKFSLLVEYTDFNKSLLKLS